MSRLIEDLHPTVQKKAQKLLQLAKQNNIELLITSTLRTEEEQNTLYAQGRTTPGSIVTNARYPFSLHNHGVAFDVVPLINGQAVWNDHQLWNTIGALGKSIGLEWGGDWALFPDKPHFQYMGGLTLQDFINGKTLEEDDQVSEWAEAAWDKASKAGIVGENTDPQDTVSKEELMVLLDRARLLEPESSNSDSHTPHPDVSDWAINSWIKGQKSKIIGQNSHPHDEVTKEELMVFLDRAGLINLQ
jgi:peptidoglycan L-alanyl-D-glutamate endopeptidase CwlK